MNGATPEVSVIIPAFNAESTLGEQLEALARQEASFPWEILVCDNGSTDGTAALVANWHERLPQLALVDASARRGAGAARNIGAQVARASLLLFCDADDVVGDEWLVQMHGALRHSTLVGGGVDGTRLNSASQRSVSWSSDTVITKPFWTRFPAAGAGNMGVHKSVFDDVGGFDESLPTAEDIDLCWRIQLAGGSFSWCGEAIVHVRKRIGLLSIFRQAYSYGVGDQRLKRKYAALIDEYRRETPAPTPSVAPSQAASSQAAPDALTNRRASWGRLSRLARPDGLANVAWRIGEWFGSRSAQNKTLP